MDSPNGLTSEAKPPLTCKNNLWSRLGSNQRPSACEADALPLSHGTGAERQRGGRLARSTASMNAPSEPATTKAPPKDLAICARPLKWTSVLLRTGRRSRPLRADVAQLVAHHLAKVRVAGSNPVIRSKVQVASIPSGGVAEW